MHSEKIKNVKYLGQLPVVDIEVEDPSHVFYGNGIATSNSHSTSYSMHSYLSAYQKVHFTTEFYCSWLTFSDWKPDPKEEIYRLVQDAKLHNVTILPPSLLQNNTDFTISGPREIVFGLSSIRNVGNAAIKNINKIHDKLVSWEGFLANVHYIKRNMAEALIKSGACDHYKLSRSEMLKQVKLVYGYVSDAADGEIVYKSLSNKELEHVCPIIEKEGLEKGLNSILEKEICIKKRVDLIKDKINQLKISTKDTNKQKAMWEKIYLGLSLSCSEIDDFNVDQKDLITCKEIYQSPPEKKLKICIIIDDKRICTTSAKAKNPGQEYAYLSVSDRTGALSNVVCWPKKYEEHMSKLQIGNVVILEVDKETWNGKEQIIINDVEMVG